MDINFNNLRLQAVFALDDVIKVLNQNIVPNNDGILLENGKFLRCGKAVIVDVDDLQKAIDELRQYIGTISACSDPDKPEDFADLSEQINKNGGLGWFNENDGR